ncbi:hypothetical protein SAMN02745248_02431 [Hathewaya proteolytica DSM 3090]|uniref:Uncharacterized protein n=1 Tax=Hathewaya proteolytica DSM 3090 TaxID=1121331 RepID=A0A1M6S292_9CLOT|nr:hypothetical protein [Hathewaya proteolytica]SHK38845.1 hypothetical protein SAMN02745248_02431 [Hathewaya proteolytica DSM 3090]
MGYTHGKMWNDKNIEEQIRKVTKELNITRMPSNSEIIKITGNHCLSNAIAKSGGFKHWSTILNLEIKKSETGLGKKYERICGNILKEKGYKVEQMSVKHPYDLLVNGCVKIDVKASNRFKYSNSGFCYTFNLEKINPTCDLYVCFCINEIEVEKVLIIPSKFLKISQLSIGNKSEYDKFINQWEYVKQYDEFYKAIK